MSKLNHIGIDSKKAEMLSDKLNLLLSNYQIFYMNTRGFHWNIKGEKFFELHLKFEELYNDLFLKIDEVAERILTLGHTPFHSYSDYLTNSKVEEMHHVTDAKGTVKGVLEAFGIILKLEREILELAADANDEGTNSLMSDYISQQEKTVWMYSAFLGK
jgi:starvation-inducible DNA-binding protein